MSPEDLCDYCKSEMISRMTQQQQVFIEDLRCFYDTHIHSLNSHINPRRFILFTFHLPRKEEPRLGNLG